MSVWQETKIKVVLFKTYAVLLFNGMAPVWVPFLLWFCCSCLTGFYSLFEWSSLYSLLIRFVFLTDLDQLFFTCPNAHSIVRVLFYFCISLCLNDTPISDLSTLISMLFLYLLYIYHIFWHLPSFLWFFANRTALLLCNLILKSSFFFTSVIIWCIIISNTKGRSDSACLILEFIFMGSVVPSDSCLFIYHIILVCTCWVL